MNLKSTTLFFINFFLLSILNSCNNNNTNSSSTPIIDRDNVLKNISEIRTKLFETLNQNDYTKIRKFTEDKFAVTVNNNLIRHELKKVDNFELSTKVDNYQGKFKDNTFEETFSTQSKDKIYSFSVDYLVDTKSQKTYVSRVYIVDNTLLNSYKPIYKGDTTKLFGFYINKLPPEIYLESIITPIKEKNKDKIESLFLYKDKITDISTNISTLIESSVGEGNVIYSASQFYNKLDYDSNVLEAGYYLSTTFYDEEKQNFIYFFSKITTYADNKYNEIGLRNITLKTSSSEIFSNGFWIYEEIEDGIFFQ